MNKNIRRRRRNRKIRNRIDSYTDTAHYHGSFRQIVDEHLADNPDISIRIIARDYYKANAPKKLNGKQYKKFKKGLLDPQTIFH